VLASGIADHPAFRVPGTNERRVRKVFDFTQFRTIASISNAKKSVARVNAEKLGRMRATAKDGNATATATSLPRS
jgi:hypothetical protein